MNFRKAAAIIIPLGLVIFLAGLNASEFLKIDCRFGLFVPEINKYGIGVFPTLYGIPYTDYPVPHTLLMYITSLGGNYVNMFTVTLPSALAGVFALLITYMIGARISRWLGGYAVLLTLSAYEFLSLGRAPAPDMFIVAATVFSFYLVYTADEDKAWKRLLFVPLCLIAGFAIRGPIGLVIPTAVVMSYYTIARKWKTAIAAGIISAFLLAACAGIMYWLCYIQGGRELADTFIRNQVYDRMESHKPLWFYFTNAMGSYALAYPLAFIVFGFYFKKLFKKPDASDKTLNLLRFLAGWMFIVLLGMSVPGTKHMRYIAPVIPAAGLTASWIFINFDKIKFFEILRKIILTICRIAPFIIILGLIGGAIVIKALELDFKLPLFIPILMMLVFGAAMFALTSGIDGKQRDFTIVAIAIATLAVVKVMTIDPIENYIDSSKKMTVAVEAMKGNRPLYFFMQGPDEDELKYMINVPPKKHFIPSFIARNETSKRFTCPNIVQITMQEIDKVPQNALIIVRESRFKKYVPDDLKERFEVIMSGTIGHRENLVLQWKTPDTAKKNETKQENK